MLAEGSLLKLPQNLRSPEPSRGRRDWSCVERKGDRGKYHTGIGDTQYFSPTLSVRSLHLYLDEWTKPWLMVLEKGATEYVDCDKEKSKRCSSFQSFRRYPFRALELVDTPTLHDIKPKFIRRSEHTHERHQSQLIRQSCMRSWRLEITKLEAPDE